MIYFKDFDPYDSSYSACYINTAVWAKIEEYKCSLYSLFDGYEKKITTYQS